jgi:hypothetical protein
LRPAVVSTPPDLAARGSRLDPATLDEAAIAAWSRLAERALEPNPFYRPEFLLPALIERGRTAELLVVTRDGQWLACLPVRRLPPSPRLPVPVLAAVTDEYVFSGTPLLDRDAAEDAAVGLLDVIRAERRAGAVLIGTWEPDGPAGQALARAAARRRVRLRRAGLLPRAGWRRTGQPHAPGPGFTRSDRKELARRTRLLTSEVGALRVVDRTADPDGPDAFLAIENSGWKADHGNPIAGDPRDAAFFRRMCREMAPLGCVELVALEAGGRVVAMECHLLDGRGFWSFKIGYDPAFGKYAPGTLLKVRTIEGLEGRPLDYADSCAVADNAHMNRLWPDRRQMETLFIPTGAFSSRVVRALLWARDVQRRVLGGVRRRVVRGPAGPASGAGEQRP